MRPALFAAATAVLAAAASAAQPPAPAPSLVPSSCAGALSALCSFVKSNPTRCLACIITNNANLTASGCTGADETHYCGQQPTPPPPVPPTPPPESACVDWVYCDADDDEPTDCDRQAEKSIIQGETDTGSGGSLEPLGLFLRTSYRLVGVF